MRYIIFAVIINSCLLLLMMVTIHFSQSNHLRIVPAHVINTTSLKKMNDLQRVADATPPKHTADQIVNYIGKSTSGARSNISEKNVQIKKSDKTFQPLLTMLHAAIAEVQTYPESAAELKQRGTVNVGFTIYPDGHLTNIKMLKSSGYPVLDQAALAAVVAVSPIKRVHQYLQETAYFTIDIRFVE